MTNQDKCISLNVLKFRHCARKAIRSIFDDQGFIELETPYLLNANTPDPNIDPIFATMGMNGQRLQLHTSPEIWLKKGLGRGLENIYQMARVFRDDPLGSHHNREFSMLEWYRRGADLRDLISDCEQIFRSTEMIARDLELAPDSSSADFEMTDVSHLFAEIAGIDLPSLLRAIGAGDENALQRVLAQKNEYLPDHASFCDAFFHVMLKYIEPNLPYNTPVVISRWPLQLAALASPCQDDPNFCDRFEIYYRGMEIANAYQECADENILRERFTADNRVRAAMGKEVFPIDEDFLISLNGLPATAGIALGIDRLFLAVLGKTHLAEVIFGF